jgi:hypothetical protein
MTDPMAPSPNAPSAIEAVWLVEATYAPGAAKTRVPFRAEHIARLRELKRQGIVVEVGAFTDVSASIIVLRAAERAGGPRAVPRRRLPPQRRVGRAPGPGIRTRHGRLRALIRTGGRGRDRRRSGR